MFSSAITDKLSFCQFAILRTYSHYYSISVYSDSFYILLLYVCSNYQMEKSFQRATAIAMVFVSRKCDIALSVLRPTTFYWTRQYVDRKATSFDCLTASASCTHLAAAIARNISHCSHIESPVQYRVTCYRRSRHEVQCIQHASTPGNAFRSWKRFTFTFFTHT